MEELFPEILKYILYFFIAIFAPFSIAKSIFNLIKAKGKYTFKIILHSVAGIYIAILLTIAYVKVLFM